MECVTCVSSVVQRVSVQNIRQDMREFRELSVSLKLAANRSPYIVDFYGYCLRDVSEGWGCVTLNGRECDGWCPCRVTCGCAWN